MFSKILNHAFKTAFGVGPDLTKKIKEESRPFVEDYNRIRNAVETFSLETGLPLQDIKEKLEKIKPNESSKDLDANCIRISLAGSFSCGKSSFINSLLGEEGLAPVKPDPSTRVVTRFKYGDSRKYLNSEGKEIDLEEYQNLAVQKRDKDDKTNVFSILTPAPFLHNIILSDVPGFGSGDNSEADDEVSRKENENADIIFYLVNGNKGSIPENDIEELVGDGLSKKGILNSGDKRKKLYVIITQMDLKPPSKRRIILENVEDELKAKQIEAKFYLYAAYEDKIKPQDKELFNKIKQELCSEICFLAKCHNDVCEQRKENRSLRKLDKIRETVKEIFESIEVNKEYWWNKYASNNGIDSDSVNMTSFSDLKNKVEDCWNGLENKLKGEIDDIDFCKFSIRKCTFFDDYAVKKCDWETKWKKVVKKITIENENDIYLKNKFKPYLSIEKLYNVSFPVEEMGYDWDGFFSSTAAKTRRKKVKEQNKELRDKLMDFVNECRLKNLSKLEIDFGDEFKKMESVRKKFNTSYNQLLSSLRG